MRAPTPVGISMRSTSPVHKPKALRERSTLAVIAPSSPADEAKIVAGLKELRRLKFSLSLTDDPFSLPEGYFAASVEQRRDEFVDAFAGSTVDGIIAMRGGYGSNYLLDDSLEKELKSPRAIIGYSDITSLQIFLWQRLHWVTFYGPMVAAGFAAGSGAASGYDEASLRSAISSTEGGWTIPLHGDAIVPGEANGTVLGGAMTLVEATIGTPWELDTRGAILLLEDRAMKPYQIDRVLMHLKQARKLDDVKGIVLGDFPECEPPVPGSPTVQDVCQRILGPLGVPIVFGAPIGHTLRPMLTVPLGVNARLRAQGPGELEILEAAVVP